MLTRNYNSPFGNSFALNSAATTNATLVKNNPTTLICLAASNNGAASAFIKIFDKITAPVVGADTPILVIPIFSEGYTEITVPINLTLGLGIAITGLVGDFDSTAVAAGQVKISLQFVQ